MIIYIEKYDTNSGNLLVDFVNEKDFIQFCNSINQYDENDNRTMLYIEGLIFKKGLSPKEGCIYTLPAEIIEFEWSRVALNDNKSEGSFSDIIGFRAICTYRMVSPFSKALSFNYETLVKG